MNAAEGMQQSSRELISDAVWRRANKYTIYESDKTPLDTAVQACNVKFLDIFFDCVNLDEQVKTRMVSNAYTNFFHHKFSQITNDHVAMVEQLLELGAEVNGGPLVFPLSVATKAGSYPDEQVKTKMVSNAYTNVFHRKFSQITNDHVAMVKRLLELGAEVNGGPLVFPLSVAIKAGSYPLVELLCQHGADLNKKDGMFGDLPLNIAAERGHYDMIEVMLKFGANVHDKVQRYSPIDWALVRGHTDCAKLLLKHGANFDLESAFKIVINHQSVAYINFLLVYCRQETQQYICKHKQDLLISAAGETNIEFISNILDIVFEITSEYPCWEELLAESGDGEIASFLIQKGADVNKLVETCGGYTPLHLVIGRGMCDESKLQVVKVLLENGASPNIHGDTSPLMLAASTDDSTDLLQLLLDYGADINWKDSEGDTAFLYSVCLEDCSSKAEFLISCAKAKHFINSQNNVGLTVLMQAARYSNVAVVKGVIKHNPDINMTDNSGNTALLHAINVIYEVIYEDDDNGRIYDTVTTLINAGCDIDLQNDDGLSPLMLAASKCSKRVVQILLDAGADINAVSKTDRTKTAVSYFQPINADNEYITACLAVFLAQGACLSYLQPKMFHRILFCNDSDTICKLISNVTGSMTVRSDKYFNYFSPAVPTFDISPLYTALVSGNASLARHFVDIMWLTKSDLTSLMYSKTVRSYLEKKNHTQCLNLLGEMSSQPVSLFRLAFVEVSSAVGTSPGRENRVNKLPLPRLLKDKLLFKSAVDFITPTTDRIHFRPLPFHPSHELYISVPDCCKCCQVWQNWKLKHQDRNRYHCKACIAHSCSACFSSRIDCHFDE